MLGPQLRLLRIDEALNENVAKRKAEAGVPGY
jgi:hypothetical protein